jgi:DNA-binding transcriptional LysR family regulator
MDIRQLEYVVAVAEEGSFTRAARRCHVAQSALSHQVARLERELGTKLFDRTSRSVHLSEAGSTLLPHAVKVLTDMSDARAALSRFAAVVAGRLRIGMTQSASQTLDLVATIGEYHQRYPGVALATESGPEPELIDAVSKRRLDIALAALPPGGNRSELAFRALVDAEPLVAIVPATHSLARRRRIRLAELTGNGFVEFRAGTTLRAHLDKAFAETGIERESSFEVGQIRDIVEYVRNGLGVAVVPLAFATPETSPAVSTGEVHVLQITDPVLRVTIGAYQRPGSTSAIETAFLELIDHRRLSTTEHRRTIADSRVR